MSNKNKKYNKMIGIEISESDIFGVELFNEKGTPFLSNAFSLHISAFENVGKTIEYINQSIKSSHIKSKDVVVGLSMQYFKLFQFLFLTIFLKMKSDQLLDKKEI